MTMRLVKMCLLVAAAGLAGCPAQGRDHGPGDPTDVPTDDPTDEPFFVDINADRWELQDGDHHGFLLMSDPYGRVSSAAITGVEMLGDDAWDLDGRFENRAIHFTSTLDNDVREFTGTFRDEVTMDLTTSMSAAPVVLKKTGGYQAP